MSYEFYKIIHLTGVALLLSGLFGLLTLKMSKANVTSGTKILLHACHGIGLLLMLISGFGLLAKLKLIQEIPQWIYIKLAIWLYFGAAVALIKRKGETLGRPLFIAFICFFVIAASLAILKPVF